MTTPAARTLDRADLEHKVKAMYRDVATRPEGEFHFEMGRGLAERLGYPSTGLDDVPADAIASFAGVGYYFDLAALKPGEGVVDLGSGSGMDSFLAARTVGAGGRVLGIDMTPEQLEKSRRLAAAHRFGNVVFQEAYIHRTGAEAGAFDAVISNGVINLAPDKGEVFREAARLLRKGGRLALADIVSETPLPEGISCDATLWAACIGGALQEDQYAAAIEAAGLRIAQWRPNSEYRFLSANAAKACAKYGVKSISLVAVKE